MAPKPRERISWGNRARSETARRRNDIMAQQEPISTRTTVAIAAAACSATLAIGITVAAVLGYVGPERRAAGADSAMTSEAGAGDPKKPDAVVVLVPVQPATAAPAIANDEGDPSALVLASARRSEREHEHREHTGHRKDDDHDREED
jgi:hypothetical protein